MVPVEDASHSDFTGWRLSLSASSSPGPPTSISSPFFEIAGHLRSLIAVAKRS